MANKAARKQLASRQSASRQSAGKQSAGKQSPGKVPGANVPAADVPVVSGREPCPCGSGRRYKACHGRSAGQAAAQFVARPFEGLSGECDWVALREIVPAATARLTLTGEFAGREATLATVLPMAWPGLVREDGTVFVGLQVSGGSGDTSRDVADALEKALAAEPGVPVMQPTLPAPGRRLQDLLDAAAPLDVEVHPGFDFWLEGVEDKSPEVVASMERANEAVVPTTRLASVEAAYWCQIGERFHLRWVMPHDEDALLDALARLHATGSDKVGTDSRYVGAFRACGLVVPVWDLEPGTVADALEEPVVLFAGRLAEAMADESPLDDAQRRARAGLRSRQLTLR
jgi:Family of unknown function (DUF5926)/SEC-C motif